jgi:hypothetical protein
MSRAALFSKPRLLAQLQAAEIDILLPALGEPSDPVLLHAAKQRPFVMMGEYFEVFLSIRLPLGLEPIVVPSIQDLLVEEQAWVLFLAACSFCVGVRPLFCTTTLTHFPSDRCSGRRMNRPHSTAFSTVTVCMRLQPARAPILFRCGLLGLMFCFLVRLVRLSGSFTDMWSQRRRAATALPGCRTVQCTSGWRLQQVRCPV